MTTEAEVRVMRSLNQRMQSILEAGKGTETDSPLEPTPKTQHYQRISDT